MTSTDLCDCNKAVALDVRDFVLNVPDVKEESITDYLVWKWRLLDSRFNFLKVKTFTRQEENTTTGADFELWLIGRTKCIPLLFQAKKFLKPFDSYVLKLNFPKNTQGQLGTLLAHAKSGRFLPFYAIYTGHNRTVRPMCGGHRSDCDTGVYMIDATTVKGFADGRRRKPLALDDILRKSNPFHCMFCCTMGIEKNYFSRHFSAQPLVDVVRGPNDLPQYVQELLNMDLASQLPEQSRERLQNVALSPARIIGVYDLRQEE